MTAHDIIHWLAPIRKTMDMARREVSINTDAHSLLVKDLILDAMVQMDMLGRALEPDIINGEKNV